MADIQNDNKVFITTWTGSADKLVFDFRNFPSIDILSDDNNTKQTRSMTIRIKGYDYQFVEDDYVDILIEQGPDGRIKAIEKVSNHTTGEDKPSTL